MTRQRQGRETAREKQEKGRDRVAKLQRDRMRQRGIQWEAARDMERHIEIETERDSVRYRDRWRDTGEREEIEW